MLLRTFKSLWGYPLPPSPSTASYYDTLCLLALSQGYYGVEAIMLTVRDPLFVEALERHSLRLIVQLHTGGGYLTPDFEYVYCKTTKVADHVESLSSLLKEVTALTSALTSPVPSLLSAVNVHSGHDSWAHTPKAAEFFLAAQNLAQNLPSPAPVFHETHRQRTLFSPHSFSHVASQPSLSSLRYNLDISHWVTVCEHVFDEADEDRDGWFSEILEKCGEAADMVHARIGHDQGPQVNDPRAPEHAGTVASHLRWWKAVWTAQKARGLKESLVTMEFGPAPYMPAVPYSGRPVADLEEVNLWMKREVEVAFAEAVGSLAPPPAAAAAAPAAAAPAASAPAAAMTILSEPEIRSLTSNSMAFAASNTAFSALSSNTVCSPVPVQLAFPDREGETCVKPGHVRGNEHYVVKVASGFQKNKEEGVPNGSGKRRRREGGEKKWTRRRRDPPAEDLPPISSTRRSPDRRSPDQFLARPVC